MDQKVTHVNYMRLPCTSVNLIVNAYIEYNRAQLGEIRVLLLEGSTNNSQPDYIEILVLERRKVTAFV